MKTLTLAALLVSGLGSPAFAKAGKLLQCSTSGSGIALLQVYKWGKSPYSAGPAGRTTVDITYEELEEGQKYEPGMKLPQTFQALAGIQDLEKGSSTSIVATDEKSPIFNNAGSSGVSSVNEKSILLRVLDGQKAAYLAVDGTVYKLRCF